MTKFRKNVVAVIFLLLGLLGIFLSCDLILANGNNITAEAASTSDLTFTQLSDGTYSVSASTSKISGELVIPSTYNGKAVTEIGKEAFYECINLTSVIIPDSVTVIGDDAFYKCSGLINVIIPEGVTEICFRAFEDCKVLTDVILPNSLTKLGNAVFDDCKSLTSIIIPEGITSIPSYAFQYCTSLASIIMPNSVTVIGDGAFTNAAFESITIPDNVTSIGASAFKYCTNLASVTLGNGVASISGSAFLGCTSLSNISIPESVTSIKGSAFQSCSNLVSVTLGNGVTSIGESAFSNCTSLKIINYSGATEEWNAIAIGRNAIPYKVTINCLGDVPNTISTGLDDYGITNSNVTVIYDGYKVKGYYSFSATSWITTANNEFDSQTVFTNEGYYCVVAKNDYAEEAALHFYIDKTAPTGMLSGVANGGYTNTNVSFTWTETNVTATLNGSSYASGKSITAEGDYKIILKDLAGNSTTYTFTIDKTAPTGTLSGVANGGYTNTNVSFAWTETNVTATLNGSSYVSGNTITAEGDYKVILKDLAGNSTEFTFVIDKTAPVICEFKEYTNEKFTINASDKYGEVSSWQYRFNDGDIVRVEGTSITLGGKESDNGIFEIRAVDEVGNTSEWITVNFALRTEFGNSESIYNSYFQPYYYVVSMSQKYFPNDYGSYSFAEYEYAYNFAVGKEWECRVIELDGGESWNYVTATNESVRQIYTDRAELDTAIDKYAKKNIGERKVVGQNGTTLNNPTDIDGITRMDALTVQLKKLPQILSEYSHLSFMLAHRNYVMQTPNSIVTGNTSNATLRFISDGISLREGESVKLSYGDALKTVICEQGWYLITESDVCGNVESYLIYIDMQYPELQAQVVRGNGEVEVITYNSDYVDSNTETMRYISFEFLNFLDDIDEFGMLSIDGRNLSARYVFGDEMPVLCYENGYYGTYEITAYDRSYNALTFTVYIAGETPSLTHTSLTNDTSVTFTVHCDDTRNEITDIKFYKIHYDGSEEKLYEDSYGTQVNIENLVYKMNVGGKYLFEFTDLYGRTVRTDALFYLKGLPTAIFRGVKDGGITKNDVTITYRAEHTLELYVRSNGEWVLTNKYEISEGADTYTISITAGADTTAVYKVLLYVTDDKNLFTEYTFEIDGIPPKVNIFTDDGNEVNKDSVTIRDFYVTWAESGYKAYYKRQGAITDSTYQKDTVITLAGTYVFTFYDSAYNELNFTVTLDNTVSYTLQGTYTLLEDGSLITKNYFIFTLSEPWSEFVVITSNDVTVVNGQKLDVDGTYNITAKDVYGNVLTLTLIVDKLPPEVTAKTVSGEELINGTSTNEAFSVVWTEENVVATFSKDDGSYKLYNGEELSDAGTYSFRFLDGVGNETVLKIIIDRTVAYKIDGTCVDYDGVFYSRSWVQVIASEEMSLFEIKDNNGTLIDSTKKISEEGTYNVTLTDLAGNTVEIKIVIDKTAPSFVVLNSDGTPLSGFLTNDCFQVVCGEENAEIKYSFNNSSYSKYDNGFLSSEGSYNFVITDRLGNSEEFTVIINYSVNYRMDGNYVINSGVFYSRSWVQVIALEEMTLFEIRDDNGTFIDNTKKISEEGTYTVTLTDLAGNTVEIKIVIDKTGPIAQFITRSGDIVCDVTNQDFKLVCEEENATVKYSFNGMTKNYNGEFLSDAGKYTFELSDYLGNNSEFKLVVDKSVSFTINGTYVDYGGAYISKTSFSFLLGEEVRFFELLSQSGIVYDVNSKITEEGTYSLSVEDLYGNRLEKTLVIDKTAPTIILQGVEDGKSSNGVITVRLDDYSTATYTYNGGDRISFNDGASFVDEGVYVITAKDVVGNTATVSFTIDLHVDVMPSLDIKWGQIITSSISFKFDENVNAVLIKDGVETNYTRGEIANVGEYELKILDELGNKKSYRWTIVNDRARSYTLNIANCSILSIEKDDVLFVDYDGNGSDVTLSETGIYNLSCESVDGIWYLSVEVDNVAPELILENTGKSVKVSNPTDKALTYSLYVNGEEKSFNMKSSAEFTEVGSYRLICTDDVGNVTEYVFELNYLSSVTIALIVVICVLVLCGIVALIVFRFTKKSF